MMLEEIKNELTGHIIPFWNRLRDNENGGFKGYMDSDLNVDEKGEKGVILGYSGSTPTHIWSLKTRRCWTTRATLMSS